MNHENVGFKQQTWWNLADFTMKVGLTTQKDDEFTNKMSDLRSGNPTQGKSPLLTCNHLQASYFDSVHLEVCLDIGRKMLDDKKESPLEFQELLAASFALQHPRYVYLERALDISIGTTTCSPTETCWVDQELLSLLSCQVEKAQPQGKRSLWTWFWEFVSF